eukprot:scaffold10432_cov66-Skeletonema_dohrnii-CCMP3373.AAC.3
MKRAAEAEPQPQPQPPILDARWSRLRMEMTQHPVRSTLLRSETQTQPQRTAACVLESCAMVRIVQPKTTNRLISSPVEFTWLANLIRLESFVPLYLRLRSRPSSAVPMQIVLPSEDYHYPHPQGVEVEEMIYHSNQLDTKNTLNSMSEENLSV